MCISAAAMMAIGTAVSVGGQIYAGNQNAKAASAQATRDETVAAQQREQAKAEAARIRKAGERTQGMARAQLAASGVQVGSGSALLIEDEIGLDSESDAMNTLLTGQRSAGASSFAAKQAIGRGKAAVNTSMLGAASTGLQGWKGVGSSTAGSSGRKFTTFAEGEY